MLATACTAADSPAPATAWTEVRLPRGFRPALLAAGPGDTVLVASDGHVSGRPGPRLLDVDGGDVHELPVSPASYYGRRVVWHGIAAADERLFAIGGRSGGAHGMTRWTAWSGSAPDGLREDVQDFETFGGPSSGGIVGIVTPAGGPPLLVGSRVSDEGSGLDVAIWEYGDRTWLRRPSSGPLAASDGAQPAAHGASVRGRGVVIAGSVTTFRDGVRTRPAIWTSPTDDGPWTRTLLPADGDDPAEAGSVACDPEGGCLIGGYAGDHLAAWRLSASGGVTVAGPPAVPAGPAPVRVATSHAAGRFAVAVSDPAGGGQVLVEESGRWTRLGLPSAAVISVAQTTDSLWLVAACPDGACLWRHVE
ncbi:hypothetical protein [Nocardioides sp. URHA0032]|uniref:hypothetical protein n=1 Tax=Nocardioides sp. URHA0032 TaxID=1380388 RepID=UPI0006846DCD|nr:hypothetical protein [Nocardioides sp. URHA0032]